jgi:hypothetical protein
MSTTGRFLVRWHVGGSIASAWDQDIVDLVDAQTSEDVARQLVVQRYGPENESARYIVIDSLERLP